MRDAYFENPAYLFSKAKRIAFTLRRVDLLPIYSCVLALSEIGFQASLLILGNTAASGGSTKPGSFHLAS